MEMSWGEIVLVPVRQVLTRVGNFIPTLVGVLVILIGGWLAAKTIQKIVTKLLSAVKLDTASQKAHIDTLLAKGDIRYSLSELIGMLSYWLIMLIVFMAAINALGLTVTAGLLNRIIGYLPNVIAAVFMLVLGIFFASLMATVVHTACSNAGIPKARAISQLTQTVIIVFASVIVLEQLGVAASIVIFALQAVIGAIAIAVGIAFGLGCKDIAARTIQNIISQFQKSEEYEASRR
jgi:hypothetical protein